MNRGIVWGAVWLGISVVAQARDERAPTQRTARTPATTNAAPSAELLEYLGQYADAAEGLDPLGFSGEEPAIAKKTERKPADRADQKQGSGE